MPLSAKDKALRKTGITATDIVALSGTSPWATPFDVFREKMGLRDDIEETLAMACGHAVEPIAMAKLADARGLHLKVAATEADPDEPWILSTPDRDVLDKPRKGSRIAAAEAKLVGWRLRYKWETVEGGFNPPDYVLVQNMWQQMQRRVRFGYVVAFFDLNDDEPEIFDVPYDEDLAGSLKEIGHKFYVDHMLTGKAPAADASAAATEMLARFFPAPKRNALDVATHELSEKMREYIAVNEKMKALEAQKALLKNQFCEQIGEGLGFRGEEFKAVWSETKGSPNWKKIAMALEPSADLITEHTSPPHRTFNVRPLTKEDWMAVK